MIEQTDILWARGIRRARMNRKCRKAVSLSLKHNKAIGHRFFTCGGWFYSFGPTVQPVGTIWPAKKPRKKPRSRWMKKYYRWCKEQGQQEDRSE